MPSTIKIYLSFDGDRIGRQVGQAILSDDDTTARRISQDIDAGNEVWRSWAMANGGEIITMGGDEACIRIGADHLKDLPELQRQYANRVGSTVSIGVGHKMSEASRALLAAKLEGGNKIRLYTPEIEEQLAKVKEKTEAEKISDEYLTKSESPPSDLHNQFKSFADQQYKEDDQKKQEEDKKKGQDGLKSQIVDILKVFKEKAPELEAVQESDPELYKVLVSMVQSMIAMAKEIYGNEAPVAKMEKIEGFQGGGEVFDSEISPNEEESSESSEESKTLEKLVLNPGTSHKGSHLPIGTQRDPSPSGYKNDGTLKIIHPNTNRPGWVNVQAGAIMGDDGVPTGSRHQGK